MRKDRVGKLNVSFDFSSEFYAVYFISYSSPGLSRTTFMSEDSSTFFLKGSGLVFHRCIGITASGFIANAASAASGLSIVYVPPLGSKAKEMFLRFFISGMKSVSPA